jgi:hypothetical protein
MRHTPLEQLRHSYKPADIRVLFVGESPPAGGTFFYRADSNLARCTQEAFSEAFGREFDDGEAFLRFFASLGCYLDDLCLVPVNRMDKADRKRQRVESIGSLAARIRAASPEAVVSVMRAIVPQVKQAMDLAGLDTTLFFSLPFPAYQHKQDYVHELVSVLRRLQRAGTLPRTWS